MTVREVLVGAGRRLIEVGGMLAELERSATAGQTILKVRVKAEITAALPIKFAAYRRAPSTLMLILERTVNKPCRRSADESATEFVLQLFHLPP